MKKIIQNCEKNRKKLNGLPKVSILVKGPNGYFLESFPFVKFKKGKDSEECKVPIVYKHCVANGIMDEYRQSSIYLVTSLPIVLWSFNTDSLKNIATLLNKKTSESKSETKKAVDKK